MRASWVAFTLILAGCLGPLDGGSSGTPGPSESGVPGTTSHAPQQPAPPPDEPAPGVGDIDGYVRDASGGVAGASVRVAGASTTSASDGSFAFDDVAAGRRTIEATGPDGRSTQRSVTVVADDTVIVFLDLPAPDAPPGPADPGEPEPAPTSRFTCDGEAVDEPHATHGFGDAALPGLTWAAVKTGFRFAVALELATDAAATLSYKVGDEPWREAASAAARDHLWVLDGLAKGKDICFRVTAGATSATHAAWLANGHTSHDASVGTYTMNLLVLAAEGAAPAELEGGAAYYADLLWDATDGWVRPGAVIVAYTGPDRMRESAEPCSTPVAGTTAFTSLCIKVFDVGVTYVENPVAAGSTYRDGIAEPRTWIRMNALHEANPYANLAGDPAREFGSVLTHELGHYAFGMGDMYTDTDDCYVASLGISIMGGNRAATEYDDADHRCNNASSIQGYVPAWTSLTQRYGEVPARPGGIDAGPDGDGGAFHFAALDLT